MNIKEIIEKSVAVKKSILCDDKLLNSIVATARRMTTVFEQGGKVLLCGNGGSAADAQHIAAELSGRFYKDRPPLYAEALHVNTSYLTAVANDYSFDDVYSRMLEAAGKPGDMLIGLSTSGNSENVLRAMGKAVDIQMTTVAMTGDQGGKIADIADIVLNVPSTDTPRIQEAHGLIGHIICQYVEEALFSEKE
ncbi:MAG: D-sedoheptulose 7-phosphate isomerase [Bacteroidales bacterium]